MFINESGHNEKDQRKRMKQNKIKKGKQNKETKENKNNELELATGLRDSTRPHLGNCMRLCRPRISGLPERVIFSKSLK
jgi:hypothetical protein